MFTCLLVALFTLQVSNRTVFIHSHHLPDGRVVTHAHPYDKGNDKDPYKTHHHSLAQFYLLNSLDLLFFSFTALASLIAVFGLIRHYLPTLKGYPNPSLHPRTGRSPPCLAA